MFKIHLSYRGKKKDAANSNCHFHERCMSCSFRDYFWTVLGNLELLNVYCAHSVYRPNCSLFSSHIHEKGSLFNAAVHHQSNRITVLWRNLHLGFILSYQQAFIIYSCIWKQNPSKTLYTSKPMRKII